LCSFPTRFFTHHKGNFSGQGKKYQVGEVTDRLVIKGGGPRVREETHCLEGSLGGAFPLLFRGRKLGVFSTTISPNGHAFWYRDQTRHCQSPFGVGYGGDIFLSGFEKTGKAGASPTSMQGDGQNARGTWAPHSRPGLTAMDRKFPIPRRKKQGPLLRTSKRGHRKRCAGRGYLWASWTPERFVVGKNCPQQRSLRAIASGYQKNCRESNGSGGTL